VLGGAGAYYYFIVYKKDHQTQTARPGPTVKPGPGGKQPGVKPPGGEQPGVKPPGGEQPGVKPPPGGQEPTEVTAVLEQGAAPAASTEITAPADGPVVWVADNGAQVNAGDDVVRLRDYTKFEKNMAEATDRLAHYQQQLDAANKKLAEGKPGADKRVAEAQAKVKEKQDLITAAKDGMAKATITAPVGGTVEQVVKPRQWANAGKPILRITGGQAPLTATFTVGDGKTFATGSTVSLTSDQGPVDCKVASYTAGKLAVTCPSGTLKAGAKLTLKP
ncbi:MAG TPA: hypothetical protein VL172_18375, partial [Kofleriaceae bacterium]|nr:hypothetical protein [Kofleriaceae bacterium]